MLSVTTEAAWPITGILVGDAVSNSLMTTTARASCVATVLVSPPFGGVTTIGVSLVGASVLVFPYAYSQTFAPVSNTILSITNNGTTDCHYRGFFINDSDGFSDWSGTVAVGATNTIDMSVFIPDAKYNIFIIAVNDLGFPIHYNCLTGTAVVTENDDAISYVYNALEVKSLRTVAHASPALVNFDGIDYEQFPTVLSGTCISYADTTLINKLVVNRTRMDLNVGGGLERLSEIDGRVTAWLPAEAPTPPRTLYPIDANCLLYHTYWNGDAIDQSIYGNNGTLFTSDVLHPITFDSEGAYFDQSYANYIRVNHSVSLLPANDWSVCGWMRMMTYPTNSLYILQKSGVRGPYQFQTYSHSDFTIPPGGLRLTNVTGATLQIKTNNVLTPGRWQFFCFTATYNVGPNTTSGIWYYADKDTGLVTDPVEDVAGKFGASVTPLYIGSNKGASAHFWGKISEIQIWGKTLSPAEVTTYFTATKASYGVP